MLLNAHQDFRLLGSLAMHRSPPGAGIFSVLQWNALPASRRFPGGSMLSSQYHGEWPWIGCYSRILQITVTLVYTSKFSTIWHDILQIFGPHGWHQLLTIT